MRHRRRSSGRTRLTSGRSTPRVVVLHRCTAAPDAGFDQLRRPRIPGCTANNQHRGDPEKEDVVSVLIRFSPPSLTADQYDQAVRRLTEEGVLPAEGLDYEICFGREGQLKVSQVWDSREQLEAFAARLDRKSTRLNS